MNLFENTTISVSLKPLRGTEGAAVVERAPLPKPMDPPNDNNFTFEEQIVDTACAVAGDVLEVTVHCSDRNELNAVYRGALVAHPRYATRAQHHEGYSELLLVAGLVCTAPGPEARLGDHFVLGGVWTDHMERVNIVRLVANIPGSTAVLLDRDEEVDAGSTPNSPSASMNIGSPRVRRIRQELSRINSGSFSRVGATKEDVFAMLRKCQEVSSLFLPTHTILASLVAGRNSALMTAVLKSSGWAPTVGVEALAALLQDVFIINHAVAFWREGQCTHPLMQMLTPESLVSQWSSLRTGSLAAAAIGANSFFDGATPEQQAEAVAIVVDADVFAAGYEDLKRVVLSS